MLIQWAQRINYISVCLFLDKYSSSVLWATIPWWHDLAMLVYGDCKTKDGNLRRLCSDCCTHIRSMKCAIHYRRNKINAVMVVAWHGRSFHVTHPLWRNPSITAGFSLHYSDVVMGTIASQITSLTIVFSTVYSYANQRKHHSCASLAFVWGIHQGPVNSPHKWPVTWKMFPFDDVIMKNE